LNIIAVIRNIFDKCKFLNGYSSHELNGIACKYAVALGCEYIERHYTSDKNNKGTDHKLSSDLNELKQIIKDIRDAEEIRGSYRNLSEKEKKLRDYYRSF